MSIFTIDSVEYPVTLPVTLRRKKLGHQRRAFSQKMRTALHDNTNIVARAWDVSIGHLTDADAATLEAALTASGTLEIAGDVINDAVTCFASEVTRQDGQISDAVMLLATFGEVLFVVHGLTTQADGTSATATVLA